MCLLISGNAFISGMQEDLSLYGNERNWLNTWFALGVMVGSVPAQMSQLKFIRPSILIPCCELLWSCLTIGMGFTKSIQAVSDITSTIPPSGLFTRINTQGLTRRSN